MSSVNPLQAKEVGWCIRLWVAIKFDMQLEMCLHFAISHANLPSIQETDEICYICLDDCAANDGTSLMSPCQCPRKVHRQCLARWQLQQAGKAEEKHCRFCLSPLADWKVSLTPEPLKQEVKKANPVMVVYFEGVVHR